MIDKYKNKRITITIPKNLYRKLQEEALYEDRSISKMVAYIIKKHYENKEK